MSFLDLFITRKLSSVLNRTYHVKVHGVKFELRKLNPIDYMNGSKALLQTFDTYKLTSEKENAALGNLSKMREHYIDVFMSAVVNPVITREKDSSKGIYVEHLLLDWDLANDLYMKILELTYGKKKLKSLTSQKKSS